jgi:hypothetical protein
LSSYFFLRRTLARRRRALRELSLYAPPLELPSPSDALQADYIRALTELAAAYDGSKRA